MLEDVLEEHFALRDAEVKRLEGYENRNYLVSHPEGKFVLKTYSPHPLLVDQLSSESEALGKISAVIPGRCPEPLRAANGSFVVESEIDGEPALVRLLTFVEGEMLGKRGFEDHDAASLGNLLATIDNALRDFRSAPIEARRHSWDLQNFEFCEPILHYIEDPSKRKYVEYFLQQAKEKLAPRLPYLRRSVIHGDANEWNIVRKPDGALALIDFGDLTSTWLVNEVAVAAAYLLMFADGNPAAAAPLVSEYCKILPLEEPEIELLYCLIALRACISATRSAKARQDMPENEYAFVSEEMAWKLLMRWAATNPLKVEDIFRKAAGIRTRESSAHGRWLENRLRRTSRAMSLQFAEPIAMTSAAFQYMFDDEGRAYLDCYNNIPHVGHCHPHVARAASRAYSKLNTNTRYLTEELDSYSERLLARFPAHLNKLFLVNSGSAATDLALRLARQHTGNEGIAVVEHGYHGNTAASIAVSHYKYAGKGGSGKALGVIEAPIPDAYRLGGEAGAECANELEKRLDEAGFDLAAFIAEPIVGCGGQVPLAEGFAERVYRIVRKRGGVCITDETQTGFGRLGKWFWGYEMHGVEPDLVILGKPIGNGHPMAAVVTTESIAGSFENGMEFFSSFGGNTVSCAIGTAVLDVIDQERLQENAKVVGAQLKDLLAGLVERLEPCGDVRGEGLFLGLELVRSKAGKEPDGALAARVRDRLRNAGILVGTDGPFDNVIKIKPPVCFTKANARELASALESAVTIEFREEEQANKGGR